MSGCNYERGTLEQNLQLRREFDQRPDYDLPAALTVEAIARRFGITQIEVLTKLKELNPERRDA